MEYRKLGTSTLQVSSVCLGTMTFGQQNSEADGHAQLDLALEHGVNFIDMAEMYPVPTRAETQGATERIVGSWLKGKPREKLVIATKLGLHSREWAERGVSPPVCARKREFPNRPCRQRTRHPHGPQHGCGWCG